jgi:hypothetical protein
MTDILSLQLEELWKLSPDKATISLEEFIERYPKDSPILKELDFDTVFYSRTYPVISFADRLTLSSKKVLFLGCSTNSPVATALLQQGLKHFILVDPDSIELSNTNRITGAGIAQLGKNKAVHLGEYLGNIHPYIKTEVCEDTLSDEKLEDVIQKADLVIEMVDDPATKITTRILAQKNNKTVLMITGIGDQPIVVVEKPGDSYFHRFTKEETGQFFNKDLSVKERFRMYCTIIGVKNIPAAVMVNMILAASGIRTYIGQHGGTAMIAGGLGAYAAREILCGREIKKEVPVNIPKLLSTSQSIEQSETDLWHSLKKDYPELFVDTDSNLKRALSRLSEKLFEIVYTD